MPDVSIITPFRDSAHFLPGLVANLQRQTLPNWECLLVDHGSADGGGDLARTLIATDPRFRLLVLPRLRAFDNQLPAIPRNRALAEIRSNLVAFLDVDDLWHPLKLERQLNFHQRNNLELSVTAFARFKGEGKRLGPWRLPPALGIQQQIRWRNPIPLLTALVATELLHKGFPMHPHEDYLLWLEVLQEHPEIRYGCLPEMLAFYRCHSTNISRIPHRVIRWTYGVYRASGEPPPQALGRLMHWGLGHAVSILRDQLPHRFLAGSLEELMERSPLILIK
jgi:glycosyltransferase involved in cell wall biosynthesis